MSDAAFEKHRDFAHGLAHHIEVVVLSSLGVIAIVASGAIVVVSSSRDITAEPLFLIVGYGVFALAFAFGAAALRSRVFVVPNSAATDIACGHHPRCDAGVEEFCLNDAVAENRAKQQLCQLSWPSSFLAIVLVTIAVVIGADSSLLPDIDVPQAKLLILAGYPAYPLIFVPLLFRAAHRRHTVEDRRQRLQCGAVIDIGSGKRR
ncbi:hypothetical protein [Candidatus Poriferisodalis sp.]|uniref:hypothetical protein n=1 Tax=Candidatus Poriferisodalis sp. TaxID=3101277 RepID=UPI003B026506